MHFATSLLQFLRVNDLIVPELPVGCIPLEDGMMTPADVPEEEDFQWLQIAKELASKATLEKADFISKHVVSQQTAHIPAVISLLLLFYENAHLIAMIRHGSASGQPEPNTCYYTRSTPSSSL